MRAHQFRKIIAVLIVGLFFLQLIPAKTALAAVDQTVYYNEIGKKLEKWANIYNIPPVLLKAIAWMESGWKQYERDTKTGLPLIGKPLIGYDGIGIGIMQISDYDSTTDEGKVKVDKLKNDIDYNIEVGCQILNQKWRAYPKIGNGDRNVLENWYFAVWGYNGWGSRNNPNNLSGGKTAYQDVVFNLMGNIGYSGQNSAITFAPGATKISKDLLPPVNPPSFSSRWSTPTPTHLGDLVIDTNQLISSGGGTGTNAANGDYWYNFARWGSYNALAFYTTAYNSSLVTDKTSVSQKILSAYGKLLAEADALTLEGKDSSDATAVKYYWTVLQGPSLDPGITVKARTGLLSALGKLLEEADKLLLEGTASSYVSAAQDYGIVLQGESLDASITERARIGFLSAHGKLLTEAEKLVLVGTGASNVSAAKYYLTVLQGQSLDASITERARIGLLSTYGKLLEEADKLALEGTELSNASAANYYSTVLQGPSLDAGIRERARIGLQQTDKPKSNNQVFSINRLFGLRAEDTAISISQAGWADNSAPDVFLARVDRFQDALAAAPLAKKHNAPLLLTAPDQLDNAVLQEMKRLGVSKVYVIGGEGAIKKTVTEALKTANRSFERIYGNTAADTAAAIARKIGPSTQVILASSVSFPDALSASAPAAALGIPILLTEQGTLPEATKQILKDFGVTKTIIVGGKFAISDAFDNKGGALVSYGPLRLAGDTKYDTMLLIVKYFNQNPTSIVIATGENFPDGLAGGAFAALSGSPMLLIPKGDLNSDTQAFLKSLLGRTTKTYILGGTGVIPSTHENIFGSLLSPP